MANSSRNLLIGTSVAILLIIGNMIVLLRFTNKRRSEMSWPKTVLDGVFPAFIIAVSETVMMMMSRPCSQPHLKSVTVPI